jgi:hypothetical protein
MSIINKVEERKKNKEQLAKEKKFTELDKNELLYLIQLIGRSDFKGKDLQILYAVTAKLQNQLNKK